MANTLLLYHGSRALETLNTIKNTDDRSLLMARRNPFFLILLIPLLSNCGFDPTSEEYDRTRYDELQKSNCEQMASLATKGFVVESTSPHEETLARCKIMKALTFEQYAFAARRARETGEWHFDDLPSAK